jgi:hypothetical protein
MKPLDFGGNVEYSYRQILVQLSKRGRRNSVHALRFQTRKDERHSQMYYRENKEKTLNEGSIPNQGSKSS